MCSTRAGSRCRRSLRRSSPREDRVLEGGSCKHLVFTVSPTPDIPAGADIALHAHAGFVESNSSEYRVFDTRQAGSGSGTVRVQAPAQIRIAKVANEASRLPYVNINQRFPVSFEVINEGEAPAESIRVALEKSGSSAIDDTLLVMGALGGATSASDTFKVTAGTASGLETFRARIRGAIDGNSRESDLVQVNPALDDTTRAIIQSLAALDISSIRPSQREVNASQAADWTVSVSFANRGEAPLAIKAPAAGDLAFSLEGTRRYDYFVIRSRHARFGIERLFPRRGSVGFADLSYFFDRQRYGHGRDRRRRRMGGYERSASRSRYGARLGIGACQGAVGAADHLGDERRSE